ncbi:major facilitator superfamily domain-containing protein [Plectosphaerella plurivora]|uniref:Major facilitator superfamily domain-containing protein n=1 Tax=Plectosphaerella plurivora TaxID=936078 RepID=A0A9P8V5T7_9PEZI|nr:major facilitator superfamily domain-containing protein [Plectosphaerella plurivora]
MDSDNTDNTAVPAALPKKLPYWRLVIDRAGITEDVLHHDYEGSGTREDPYVISWIPHDPRDPMGWTLATLAVALVSSAYSGGVAEIIAEFDISSEVAILGVSLFVLGFAIGPLFWAPLSELYGRQVLFIGTYALLTAFNAGCAGAKNAETLMVLRFFAGAFGSSPLTNAGGIIADMFPASQRGLAMAIFAAAPFLGPALGPVIGGFLGMAAGWRWVMGFLAAFTGFFWIVGSLLIPETYGPVLLQTRAKKLSKMTGKVYISRAEHQRGPVAKVSLFKTALSRPWVLLFKEPIVLLLSIYMSVIYGTLYLFFAAFPIVFQQQRGWNAGEGGLAFLGITVGMMGAICYVIPDNNRYIRVQQRNGGAAPAEARLPPCIVGSFALPIGLFWFAWTCQSSVHFMVSIAAGVPFGFGMVLVFLSGMNYLIDSYTLFAASALAANSVLRSLFGAVFPLFTRYMYDDLGVNWATSIPAFLTLACLPFPLLFYKYGAAIRKRCKFAAESEAFMEKMRQGAGAAAQPAAEIEKKESVLEGSRPAAINLPEASDRETVAVNAMTEGQNRRTLQPRAPRRSRSPTIAPRVRSEMAAQAPSLWEASWGACRWAVGASSAVVTGAAVPEY